MGFNRPALQRLLFEEAEKTAIRASRRIQGKAPEFGLLPPRLMTTNATMSHQEQQTESQPALSTIVFLPVALRTPTLFHGEDYEGVDDWLQHYERVARHNHWTPEQILHDIYFSLDGTARLWFENHEATFTSWGALKSELRQSFASQQRRERAEELLWARVQGPNESVVNFVEDVLRLCNRADPQAPDAKKLKLLMRGVSDTIFGGIVRNPPTSVESFVTEATNIERALSARTSHYKRLSGVNTPAGSLCDLGAGLPGIRELIRDVVREELQKLLPAAGRPPSLSIAEVVRKEVQRALGEAKVL